MTKYLYPILLPCLAALLCACEPKAPPAEKNISPAGQPASAAASDAAPVFSLASLDSGKVDPGLRGVDPAGLVRALEGIMAVEKGEFESTADFTQRKNSLLSNKIMGEYGIDDAFPFIVEVGKYASCLNGIRYAYDADKSRATLHLSAWSDALGDRGYSYSADSDAPKYDTLVLRRDDKKDTSYMGVNAFGVSTPVKVSRGVIYQVAAKKIPYIKGRRTLSCEEKKAAFAWQVDAAVAEKELPSLKAMLIVKLKPPYVLYSDYQREPTRDDPVDIEVQTRAVFGDVVKVVVYSGITGNIISQFPQ